MPFERGPYLSVAAFCEQVIEDKSGRHSWGVQRIDYTSSEEEAGDTATT